MKAFLRVRNESKETSKSPFSALTKKNKYEGFESSSLRQASSLERQMKTLK